MAARLGTVIYWTGCIVAGFIVALVASGAIFGGGKADPVAQGMAIVLAAVTWGIGRAAKYVLAGT